MTEKRLGRLSASPDPTDQRRELLAHLLWKPLCGTARGEWGGAARPLPQPHPRQRAVASRIGKWVCFSLTFPFDAPSGVSHLILQFTSTGIICRNALTRHTDSATREKTTDSPALHGPKSHGPATQRNSFSTMPMKTIFHPYSRSGTPAFDAPATLLY